MVATALALCGCESNLHSSSNAQTSSDQPTEVKIGDGVKQGSAKGSGQSSAKGSGESLTQDAATDEASDGTVNPLISAVELKKLLDSKPSGVKILEPGKDESVYQAGHLPTAQFVHWIDDMTDPAKVDQYNNLQADQFAKLMCELGIQADDRVIIYDRMTSRLSTRLFWTFKCFGHTQVQILDGGFENWKSESLGLSTDTPKVLKSQYEMQTACPELCADMKFVQAQLNDPKTRLVDGRPAEQYSGQAAGRVFHTGAEHPRKGHITGAVNIFWKDNFNQDGTFKSIEELRKLYTNASVHPDDCVVTYCNEGLHAAPPWFILTQLLDYKNVRLYDSSMAEWASSENPMSVKKNLPAKKK